MTQNERILRHLIDYGSITPVEALRDYGCMRLGARIFELKREGHAICREFVDGRNRYGEKTRYARYTMGR